MPGEDERFHTDMPNEEQPADDGHRETSASVIFTEIMRRAAGRQQPEEEFEDEPEAFTPEDEPEDAPITNRTPEELRRDAKMQAQKVRRVQRRRQRRRDATVGVFGGILRTLFVVGISGVLMATILSWWTDPEALNPDLRVNLGGAVASDQNEPALVAMPTVYATPNYLRRIGIVSGHSGIFMNGDTPTNDPGAVCEDASGNVILTEQAINLTVANQVVNALRGRGYTVDLLEEFDARLDGYEASALISIHSNDCSYYPNADGSQTSAFLVSQAQDRPVGGEDTRLMECLADEYQAVTALERRFSLTRDMTDYHIFREIDVRTPGVIIEIGFMLGDQDLLVNRPDVVAQGVINGILCFMDEDTPNIAAVSDGEIPESTATP
ncbi:MAG: N-acetylmuramoyl-L-alanine amidase [Aggregatilineales bacterium]